MKKEGLRTFDYEYSVYHYLGAVFDECAFLFDSDDDDKNQLLDNLVYCYENSNYSKDTDKLADLYLNGYVNLLFCSERVDINKAIELYEKADTPLSYISLGNLYVRGEKIKKNLNKGIECFVKVGDMGYPRGYGLAGYWLKENGKLQEAVEYYVKAAEDGDEESIEALRKMKSDIKGTIAKGLVNKVFSILEEI